MTRAPRDSLRDGGGRNVELADLNGLAMGGSSEEERLPANARHSNEPELMFRVVYKSERPKINTEDTGITEETKEGSNTPGRGVAVREFMCGASGWISFRSAGGCWARRVGRGCGG